MKKYKKYKKNKPPKIFQPKTQEGVRQSMLSSGAIGEVLYKKALVTLIGQEELWIENYKAILEYKENCIIVSTFRCSMKITGRNLRISHYSLDDMMITGYIVAVEYIGKGGDV